jgi:hypothetical protein
VCVSEGPEKRTVKLVAASSQSAKSGLLILNDCPAEFPLTPKASRDLLTNMYITTWLLLSLSGLAVSSPFETHAVHEKRHSLPIAWTKQSRARSDTIVPVRIGLNQRNLEHGDRFLDDISDPESPNFGKEKI